MYISAPFTVDATPPDERILCHASNVRQVTIYEDAQEGTVNYLVKDKNANGPITRPAGSKHTFTSSPGSPWGPGELVGYVSTATGSANFVQEEI